MECLNWKFIIIATTSAGGVAIHETQFHGTEEAAKKFAKNLTENNRLATVGVTLCGMS